VLMGECGHDWQNIQYILSLFSTNETEARILYDQFVEEGAGLGKRPELTGGGLIRSLGGWTAAKASRKSGERIKGDERILGKGNFVQEVLSKCREGMERRYRFKARGHGFDWLVDQVAALFKLERDIVTRPGRYPETVEARSVLCYWSVRELGLTTLELSGRLHVSQPAISHSVKRGEGIVKRKVLRISE